MADVENQDVKRIGNLTFTMRDESYLKNLGVEDMVKQAKAGLEPLDGYFLRNTPATVLTVEADNGKSAIIVGYKPLGEGGGLHVKSIKTPNGQDSAVDLTSPIVLEFDRENNVGRFKSTITDASAEKLIEALKNRFTKEEQKEFFGNKEDRSQKIVEAVEKFSALPRYPVTNADEIMTSSFASKQREAERVL